MTPSHITYHADLVQGSDEWHDARRGILTASEMKLILTPTLKVADNKDTRVHVYELLAQRLTGHVEESFVGFTMMRGHEDEIWARIAYAQHIATVDDVGFITNNKWGFTLGYSPDGVIGSDGLIECKSRVQKYQTQTIVEHVAAQTIPDEFVLQCQTGLLVSERKWLDFLSYSNGMPMPVIRVFPDPVIQDAIIEAATAFEAKIEEKRQEYLAAVNSTTARIIPIERREIQEMHV